MVARESVCLRRLGKRRSQAVRFGRFLANENVTVERLIDGWSEQTSVAARGRHVLAIQDTTEINFHTIPERRRGLGEIGKGNGHGVLLHAMLAVDAHDGTYLGLVAGQIWTRKGRVRISHDRRPLANKESGRWLATAEQAKLKLAAADTVTVIDDREGDIYAKWARLPGPGFHLITRVMHDRVLADGSSLYVTGEGLAPAATTTIELPARGPQRPARRVQLILRYGPVQLRRPLQTMERGLPAQVRLNLIEVIEPHPPKGTEPVYWRLLTTHHIADPFAAWRVVNWYKERWTIEQLFRVLKTQGLKLEDSQLATADRLLKLTAIAAKAAAITINSSGRATAWVNSARRSHSVPLKSKRSRHSPPSAKARPDCRKILIRSTVSLGQRGPSPVSEGGTVILHRNHPAQSPSGTGLNTSMPSSEDGPSKMCACPSAFAGTT